MKFLNEFIFDNEIDAKRFIKEMSDLFYNKGYLYYGDVCKAYYNDNIDYNHYDIYTRYGWICIYIFMVEPYLNNKFIVRFPEIEKIRRSENNE